MVIKVLGGGCKNCLILADNVEIALQELNLNAEIIKVTDFREILQYDIMATPGLVIDEKLLSSGKVLKPREIVEMIKKQFPV